MMRRTGEYLYAESPLWQAVRLPYQGGVFSLTALLPRKDNWLGELEGSLDTGFLEALERALAPREVQLHLPKVRIEGDFRLAPTLRGMGMRSAFDPESADFSGITSSQRVFISEVVHKTFIAMGEEGTEAAAATATAMLGACAPREERDPVVFRADHPFTFALREERTGTVLFLGRLADPSR
jgi:serpin B